MQSIGFIGLGVMGEPICRHLVHGMARLNSKIIAFDLASDPVARLVDEGAEAAASVKQVFDSAELVFLSLPGGTQVQEVMDEAGWFEDAAAGKTLVDLGTTPVEQTRQLAQALALHGVNFIDAPVARTRQAAEQGTLAVMVGGPSDIYQQVAPLFNYFASEVVHCGGHGCGQVVKILNNMVLFQTVLGLAEAVSVAESAGVEPERLFEALSNGSADSFALRNHGMKSLLPEHYPLQAFSTRYADKDLDYALQLATQNGIQLRGAATMQKVFSDAIEAGLGDQYWPVIKKVVEQGKV